MPRRTQTKTETMAIRTGYDTLLSDAIHLLEEARRTAARVVNSVITTTYWHLGRRISNGSCLAKSGLLTETA
jgi:hypothetical protein